MERCAPIAACGFDGSACGVGSACRGNAARPYAAKRISAARSAMKDLRTARGWPLWRVADSMTRRSRFDLGRSTGPPSVEPA